MATVTINIPDAHAAAIRDAFAEKFGWDSSGQENKTQFLKRMLAKYVKDVYKEHTGYKAGESASQGLNDVTID